MLLSLVWAWPNRGAADRWLVFYSIVHGNFSNGLINEAPREDGVATTRAGFRQEDDGSLKMLASEEGVNVVYVSLAIFAVGTCWLWTYWRPPGGGN